MDMDQEKISEAVQLRLAYDYAIRNRWHDSHPIDVVGRAAGKWLDAEQLLNDQEYKQYMMNYERKKREQEG